MVADAPGKIRVDKWLWHARFFKSRGLAGDLAGSGQLRVNGAKVEKPSHAVRPGDVLTFSKERQIRVIRVEAIGQRRGPAPEAQTLYTDLDPPVLPKQCELEEVAYRDVGSGRPTKRARREIDALRRREP